MKLEEIITQINDVDEDLIIFQKGELGLNSEITLFSRDEIENLMVIKEGIKYFYLLEVSIAKEFVADWMQSLKIRPDNDAIAKRIFEYAINDA